MLAALQRVRDVLEYRINLFGYEHRRRLEHVADAHGVLRGERGHGRLGEQPEGRDGLDIRLDARAAARVGAGDGEYGGQCGACRGQRRKGGFAAAEHLVQTGAQASRGSLGVIGREEGRDHGRAVYT